jgi:hypothetical protein
MDNNTPNEPIPNPDNLPQSAGSSQPGSLLPPANTPSNDDIAPKPAGGMKVIQPFSNDLTSKSATPNVPASPLQTPPVVPNETTTNPAQEAGTPLTPTTPPENGSFTVPAPLPDPTSVFSENNPVTQPIKKSKLKTETDTKTTLVLIGVILLGIYITVPALLGLFSSITILSYGFAAGGLLYVIEVLYVLIGVGILLRRELARVAYMVLAVIGLGFSIYGTHQVLSAISAVKRTEAVAITDQQQALQQLQANGAGPGVSSAQNQQLIIQLQNDIAQLKSNKFEVRLYEDLAEGYLLAILPLIFLTRPSVKAIFR